LTPSNGNLLTHWHKIGHKNKRHYAIMGVNPAFVSHVGLVWYWDVKDTRKDGQTELR